MAHRTQVQASSTTTFPYVDWIPRREVERGADQTLSLKHTPGTGSFLVLAYTPRRWSYRLVTTMGGLAKTILHPFVALDLVSEEDYEGEGIDVVYIVTFFLAVGIWLVVKRHLDRLNSAVDFDYHAEKVRVIQPLKSFFVNLLR